MDKVIGQAVVVSCFHPIIAAYHLDGEQVLEGVCPDYEAYCALPPILSWSGVVCRLTGWNSDLGRAFWKSDKP